MQIPVLNYEKDRPSRDYTADLASHCLDQYKSSCAIMQVEVLIT